MARIYPTHSCFDDVIEFGVGLEASARPFHRLVHGICRMNGARFTHAWIERTEPNLGLEEVLQSGLVDNKGPLFWYALPRDQFLATLSVERAVTYDWPEAFRLAADHNGPWDADIRSLTRNVSTPRVFGEMRIKRID